MTTPNQPGPSQPTPEERFERAVAGLRELPPTGAVTFRGITSPSSTQPGVVVPRGITATSRDLVVATAGMTSRLPSRTRTCLPSH
ncbi:hypothetical protein [Actinomyces ruminicola]|uniref:Uncharacterized protein n=1 Tax=Actinomyces ruminicola TaxID=332524 RepID=A0A1G9RHK9_9ACTO|nr:hypothetical protein [Actinomyces ruminicola]SDM22683.1 hypothetical protein SAMN04487766_1015 [Actinomyces ruminicola]